MRIRKLENCAGAERAGTRNHVCSRAHAGCGLYSPVPHAASWQLQIASPRLVLAALTTDDDDAATTEPSIVGTWKQI